jgi:diguanylate cyclase (GGDEF)-like protein
MSSERRHTPRTAGAQTYHYLASIFGAASLIPVLILGYVTFVYLLPATREGAVHLHPTAVSAMLLACVLLSLSGFVFVFRTASRLSRLAVSLAAAAPRGTGMVRNELEALNTAARKLKNTTERQKNEIWQLKQQQAALSQELKRAREVLQKGEVNHAGRGTWDVVGWREYLNQEVERSRRYHRLFCVLFVRIDKFTERVRGLRQPEKEEVAQLLTDRLRKWIRASDLMAGGPKDHFVLLLPETDSEGGVHVGERLASRFPGEPVVTRSALEGFTFTVSVGIASYPSDARDAEPLVHCARTAMNYAAHRKNGPVLAFDRHLMETG